MIDMEDNVILLYKRDMPELLKEWIVSGIFPCFARLTSIGEISVAWGAVDSDRMERYRPEPGTLCDVQTWLRTPQAEREVPLLVEKVFGFGIDRKKYESVLSGVLEEYRHPCIEQGQACPPVSEEEWDEAERYAMLEAATKALHSLGK